jgi:hypothetical protein
MRRLFDMPQNKKPVLTADGEPATTAHVSGATLPKRRSRAAHLMTLDTATFSAATTRLLSPAASRAIARSRKSIE